jgi:eukaryotic-like serine/threonine-protein kinase
MRRKKLYRALVLVLALLLSAGAVVGLLAYIKGKSSAIIIAEGDWPMEGKDQVHRAYLEAGPQRPLQEAWNVRLQEELTAPPAVAGNRLFIGGKQGVLYCLDAGNGRPFWEFDAGSEILSTPSLLGDRVYVGTGGGNVYALDLAGREIWRRGLGDSVKGAPLPVGDHLYVGSQDTYVYCLDIEKGETIWKFKTGGPVEVTPCAAEGYVFCLSQDGSLYALSQKNGEVVWEFPSNGFFVVTAGTEAGRLFLLTEFEIFCLDTQTGREIWKQASNAYYRSNLAIRGNQVIAAQGDLTGATIEARDTRTGDSLWKADAGGADRTRIVASNKEVYIATTEGIYSFGVDSGMMLLEQILRGILPQTLTVTSDAIYVTTENFKVYCYRHLQ